jgi:hypothetical protein
MLELFQETQEQEGKVEEGEDNTMSMSVTCTFCQASIKSYEIKSSDRLKEIITKTQDHVMRDHPDKLAEVGVPMGMLIQGAAIYLVLTTYLDIPPTEEGLLKEIDRFEEFLLSLLDIEEDEGEGVKGMEGKVEVTPDTPKKRKILFKRKDGKDKDGSILAPPQAGVSIFPQKEGQIKG